jgi:hypothetical protein
LRPASPVHLLGASHLCTDLARVTCARISDRILSSLGSVSRSTMVMPAATAGCTVAIPACSVRHRAVGQPSRPERSSIRCYILAVVRLNRSLERLDVRRRNRLLVQPDGFEGFTLCPVTAHSRCPCCSHRPYQPPRQANRSRKAQISHSATGEGPFEPGRPTRGWPSDTRRTRPSARAQPGGTGPRRGGQGRARSGAPGAARGRGARGSLPAGRRRPGPARRRESDSLRAVAPPRGPAGPALRRDADPA